MIQKQNTIDFKLINESPTTEQYTEIGEINLDTNNYIPQVADIEHIGFVIAFTMMASITGYSIAHKLHKSQYNKPKHNSTFNLTKEQFMKLHGDRVNNELEYVGISEFTNENKNKFQYLGESFSEEGPIVINARPEKTRGLRNKIETYLKDTDHILLIKSEDAQNINGTMYRFEKK